MAAAGRAWSFPQNAAPTGRLGQKSGDFGPSRVARWRSLGLMGVLCDRSWPSQSLEGGGLAAGGPGSAPCLSARRRQSPVPRVPGLVSGPSLPSVANPHPGFGPLPGPRSPRLPEKHPVSQKVLCPNGLNRRPFPGFEPIFACGRGPSSLPLWQPTQVHRHALDSPAWITSAQAPDWIPSLSSTPTSRRAGRGGNVRPPAPASGPSGCEPRRPRPSPTRRPRPTPVPACDRARG